MDFGGPFCLGLLLSLNRLNHSSQLCNSLSEIGHRGTEGLARAAGIVLSSSLTLLMRLASSLLGSLTLSLCLLDIVCSTDQLLELAAKAFALELDAVGTLDILAEETLDDSVDDAALIGLLSELAIRSEDSVILAVGLFGCRVATGSEITPMTDGQVILESKSYSFGSVYDRNDNLIVSFCYGFVESVDYKSHKNLYVKSFFGISASP